jgi:hypothetical protein
VRFLLPEMKYRFAIVFFVLIGTFTATQGWSQSQEKMYSLMLLSFAKGIYWPESSSGDFVIGVIEYPPLIPELEKTTAQSIIYGKKVKVVDISDVDAIAKCHIVFLPAYKSKMLPKVLDQVANTPVLIVTTKADLIRNGSCVDLVLREGKLTFDLNTTAIQRRGLKIGSYIKSAGNVVDAL